LGFGDTPVPITPHEPVTPNVEAHEDALELRGEKFSNGLRIVILGTNNEVPGEFQIGIQSDDTYAEYQG
jgi:hypothetical protein